MKRPLVIIPHGTGIGDFVMLRPLLEAVVREERDRELAVLGPPALAPLLPSGLNLVASIGGMPSWQRAAPNSPAARLSSRLPHGPLVGAHPRAIRAAARAASWYARVNGNDVLSFLELLVEADFGDRWTPGPWNPQPRHLIDILADGLEARGIHLPRAQREPKLPRAQPPPSNVPGVLLVPASGTALKSIPIGLLAETGALLHDGDVPCAVLSSPGWDAAQEMAARTPTCTPIETPDIRGLVRAIAASDLVIAPDTGALHIAAATGTRFVGLFGPTDPLFLGPYGGRGVRLRSDRAHEGACRTCWALQLSPLSRCPVYRDGTCMHGFSAEQIASAAFRLLGDTGEHPGA